MIKHFIFDYHPFSLYKESLLQCDSTASDFKKNRRSLEFFDKPKNRDDKGIIINVITRRFIAVVISVLFYSNLPRWSATASLLAHLRPAASLTLLAMTKKYNKYHNIDFDPKALEEQISELMKDEYEEITSKKGIYEYVLSGDDRFLSIRAFRDSEKRMVYERQNGICPKCGKHFDIKDMEADHITPYSKGGHTTIDNCQMLCRDCNRRKSAK